MTQDSSDLTPREQYLTSMLDYYTGQFHKTHLEASNLHARLILEQEAHQATQQELLNLRNETKETP